MGVKYDCKCPVGRTMNLIGDRWAVMMLRDLFRHKTRRFQDFMDSLRGLSPNTLSARLKSLEHHDVIAREFYDDHPPRAEYKLTTKGRDLGPVILAMRKFGEKYRYVKA